MTVYLSNRDGDGKTNEEGHLRLLSKVLEGEVLTSADLEVSQNSPLGLSVIVSAGDYRLETSGGNYAYMGWLDDDEEVTITSPDPSNPRITSIVLYVDKSEDTAPTPPNNPGVAKVVAVNGAASGTPSAPSDSTITSAIGSGNPYLVLANVTVGAGATQVTNSDISDQREPIKLNENILSPEAILTSVGPLLFPVGSIYTNATDNTNPATLLGFGTWSSFGQGRVLVSVNTGDTDFGAPGATGGSKTVTLTEAQMPNHSHTVNPPSTTTSSNGSHDHSMSNIVDNGGNNNGNAFAYQPSADLRILTKDTGSAGSHTHTVNIAQFNSGSKGSSQSHTNLQPYITVYMWRRTA